MNEGILFYYCPSLKLVQCELAILASSSEVPLVLEFLPGRKLESNEEVAASEFSHLNHSLSHRPVSVKPDISKASSAGGKLHILKPSCERNGITPTPKESLSPTSGSKVPNSPLTGKNKESYKFPIAVQQSFNSLWSQDVRGDPDSGIGGLQISPPHHDFSLMDILPGKSTRIPVKTIIRCKCVCKKWRNMVLDSYFVNLYLSRSSTPGLIVHYSSFNDLHNGNKRGTIKLVEIKDDLDLELDVTKLFKTNNIAIVGSVNGLICLLESSPEDVDGLFESSPEYKGDRICENGTETLWELEIKNNMFPGSEWKRQIPMYFIDDSNDTSMLIDLFGCKLMAYCLKEDVVERTDVLDHVFSLNSLRQSCFASAYARSGEIWFWILTLSISISRSRTPGLIVQYSSFNDVRTVKKRGTIKLVEIKDDLDLELDVTKLFKTNNIAIVGSINCLICLLSSPEDIDCLFESSPEYKGGTEIQVYTLGTGQWRTIGQVSNHVSLKGTVMAEENAFLVDFIEGGLCVDNTDARIGGRCYSRSNKNKAKIGER
ncbi:F-box associated domain containing protein [Tanacetum coccineum]|uniref:F-box associated domain containing protein n=1 Tax=Tanacetum coccineum TaxID=301880 RepID=A0ABQ4XJ81_9ASTR